MLNAYYNSHEAYVTALAREMRREYRAVVDSGLLLQIDAPDLAMEHVFLFQDKSATRHPLLASENATATTSLLVAWRQPGHLSRAQRPAIRLSLTAHCLT